MYVRIEDGEIVPGSLVRVLPEKWNDGTRDWDLRGDPPYLNDLGWFQVVETQRPADDATTTHDYALAIVDGVPTETWTPRPKTDVEIREDAELRATVRDLGQRVRLLEAAVWPAPPDPTTPTDPTVKTFEQWGGVWPNQALVLDGGVVYRNVSGGPITTAPTDFPGSVGAWTHLFVAVLGEPVDPTPTAPAWAAGVAYIVDQRVTYAGRVYKCRQAHTSQVGWEPSNVAALWLDEGPV